MCRESGHNSKFCVEVSSYTDIASGVGARSISGLVIGRRLARVVVLGVSIGAAMESGSGVEPPALVELSIRLEVHPDRMSSPQESAVYSRPPKVMIRPGA